MTSANPTIVSADLAALEAHYISEGWRALTLTADLKLMGRGGLLSRRPPAVKVLIPSGTRVLVYDRFYARGDQSIMLLASDESWSAPEGTL